MLRTSEVAHEASRSPGAARLSRCSRPATARAQLPAPAGARSPLERARSLRHSTRPPRRTTRRPRRRCSPSHGADRPAALVGRRAHPVRARSLRRRGPRRAAGRRGADQRLAATALRGEILAAQGKVDDAIKLLTPEQGRRRGRRSPRPPRPRRAPHPRRAAAPTPSRCCLKFADEYGSDAISSNDAEGLAMVGRAMHLLRHPKDANRAYNESERAERGASRRDPPRRDAALAGRSLLRHVRSRATPRRSLLEALKIAPHRADANVLLARVKLEESFDFEAARGARRRGARRQSAAHRGVRRARGHRAARHGPRRRQRRDRRRARDRSERPRAPQHAGGGALPRRRQARLRGGEARGLRAQQGVQPGLRHHRRLRRVGAPLRRRRRDDERGRRCSIRRTARRGRSSG